MKKWFWIVCIIFSFSSSLLAQRAQESEDALLAAQYMREENYEKALVLYQELFEKDPSPIIYNNYLKCLLELEEFRDAERLVQQQMNDNPGRVRFEVDLGYVQSQSGNQRRARRQMEGLIDNLHPYPMAVNDLANAFIFRDFVDYALQTYLKGRDLLGRSHPFNIELARIYEQKGEFTKMMEEYVELLVIDESEVERIQGFLQDAINDDPDYTKTQALRQVLLQKAQSQPSQTIFVEMLLWFSLQQKDFVMAMRQARALDRRFGNEGKMILDVARIATSNEQYEIGKQGFSAVVSMGDLNPHFMEAKVGLLNVKYLIATQSYAIDYTLLNEVKREYEQTIENLGVGRHTVSLVRNLANLRAFYLNDTRGAVNDLQTIIDMPNIPNRVKGECRVEMADILLLQGDLWDAHLLYALVDKTFRDDPLGHEARYKNARLSFFMAEFNWAKAQLDVLKAATSRLIANDAMALSLLIQDNLGQEQTSIPLQMFARSQMHVFMNNFDKALGVLDSMAHTFSAHQIMDDVLMSRAEIYLRTGEFQNADTIFARVAEKYPDGLHASDALYKRALLNEKKMDNKELAMELYEKLILEYTGSLNTVYARNRFRYLRGDISSEELLFRGL